MTRWLALVFLFACGGAEAGPSIRSAPAASFCPGGNGWRAMDGCAHGCAATCIAHGAFCGEVTNRCDGGVIDCGDTCVAPFGCGDGGTPNTCGCTPVTSCNTLGWNCGTIEDAGCGGPINCGGCDSGYGWTCMSGVCSLEPPEPDSPYMLQFATADEQDAMGAECACTPEVVMGNGGEIVTNVHDGGEYCTRGNWLTGIATGDVVLCPSDTPRVMSGDGTLKGVLAEIGTFNQVDDTVQGHMGVDMSAWLTAATGGNAVAIISYPDAGLCPDGTLTATRIILPSAAAGTYSQMYRDGQCQNGPGAKMSGSAYIRGYSGDGGVDFNFGGGGIARKGYHYALWNRAMVENFTDDNAYIGIGVLPDYVGVPSEPAADFFLCGLQCETLNHATSYSSGHRAGDELKAVTLVPMMSDLRISADILTENASPAGGAYLVNVGYPNGTYIGSYTSPGAKAVCQRTWSTVADTATETGTSYVGNTSQSLVCAWDGDPDVVGQIVSCLGESCQDAGLVLVDAGATFATANFIEFGGRQDDESFKSQPDGIMRNIVVQTTAEKFINLFGDSIVEERGIPQLVMRGELGRAVSVYNYGSSGNDIDDCAVQWNTVVAGIRAAPATAYRNYLLIQCGTNSLGIDAGFITDTLKGLMTDARDAGAHPIWSTIIPRDDHCAAVQTVNATMRAWCVANGFNYVETWANLLASRADPCSGIVVAYQRDSVHLNDAGTTAMTELWVWGNDGGTWEGFKP